SAFDFNLATSELPNVETDVADDRRARCVEMSRGQYATPKAVIEELLRGGVPNSGDVRREPTRDAARPRAREPVSQEPIVPPAEPPVAGDEPAPSRKDRQAPRSGRGGPQHKYLQALIKRSAEDRGFRATIEKPVLDGHGHVDVLLER